MPYKHPHKYNNILSSSKKGGLFLYLVYFVSIVEPLSAVPQIYNIWI